MSTPGRAYQDRQRFAERLRALRGQAGLTGIAAARQAGMSQSKLSKHETGMLLPSTADLEALCRVYDADADTVDDLTETLAAIRNETISARTILRRGAHRMQHRIAQFEAEATHVRTFQPALVIGLLQTPDYFHQLAAAELGAAQVETVTEAKTERTSALGTSGKVFTLLVPEGALRAHVGGPKIMAAQVEAIADATHTQGVHIGVIPWTTPLPVYPEHGFDAYDDTAVILGTETATAIVTNPSDITVYLDIFDALVEVASFGDEARDALARIAADYHGLTE